MTRSWHRRIRASTLLPALVAGHPEHESGSCGAVYDAVVADTATYRGLRLLTRDRRARPTYDALGARYVVL